MYKLVFRSNSPISSFKAIPVFVAQIFKKCEFSYIFYITKGNNSSKNGCSFKSQIYRLNFKSHPALTGDIFSFKIKLPNKNMQILIIILKRKHAKKFGILIKNEGEIFVTNGQGQTEESMKTIYLPLKCAGGDT